jgi:hypothetical protein
MSPIISIPQARFLRLKSQNILQIRSPHRLPPERLLAEIIAVQAQDAPSAFLSIHVRGSEQTAAAIEEARQVQRSIMRTWLMRGTLHLAASEDAAWLLPFLGPVFMNADCRRLHQLGWNDEQAVRAVGIVENELVKTGRLSRTQVTELLRANGFPFEGQATAHLVYLAALKGILCLGDDRSGKTEYHLANDWVGNWQYLDRSEALEKLAFRYLSAYGPAAPEDFAKWSGLPLKQAREAWKLISSQLEEVEIAGQATWMLGSRISWLSESYILDREVHLLPRFDTFLLGYANRSLIVSPENAKKVNAGGGLISAVLLVGGQVKGSWKLKRVKRVLVLEVEPFEPLNGDIISLVEQKAVEIGNFLQQETMLQFSA